MMLSSLAHFSWFFWLLLVILAVGCWAAVRLAIRYFPQWGLQDRFEAHSTHEKPKPRGGGVIIALLFFIALPFILTIDWKFLGFLLGGLLIVGINFLDDKYRIHWLLRLVVELVACFVVVASGIEIAVLTNPVNNEAWLLYQTFPLISKLFTVFWILLFVNMINWLDGIDGLATGISSISFLTLFGLSLLPFVNQPQIAELALILVVLTIVFLRFNFFPAQIKLGDSGATFLGYALAVLAIFSSAKVATFFLVLGIPLLDVVWVIMRRVFFEKKSPMKGDKKHLHHRLMNIGLTVPQVCFLLYGLAAVFGFTALFLQGAQAKLAAIVALCAFAVLFFATISVLERTKKH